VKAYESVPRTARIDAPGVLHHVMIRGIERRKISTLKNYFDLQREECDILNSELEGMIWVLKKAAV
jgi:hypothetical protein